MDIISSFLTLIGCASLVTKTWDNLVVDLGLLADDRKSTYEGGGAKWPDHISDVKRAIGWVKRNIEQYGGDAGHIVIAGGSAGGHLASLAALTPNFPAFQPGFEDSDTTVQVSLELYFSLMIVMMI